MVQARFINDTTVVNVRSKSEIGRVGIKSGGDHSLLINRDLPDQHPMSAIIGLVDTLGNMDSFIEAKVDKVNTANVVYGTDENGDQITYNADSFGQVDDVQVGGISVVTNKIAELGTMAVETASDYYTKTETDDNFIGKSYEDIVDNHIADTDNPHQVTKAQIGLGNVENLASADMPMSTATKTYVDNADTTLQGQITTLNTTIGGYGNIVTHNVSEFATAAQGAKADTALQPLDNITELTNNAGYITASSVKDGTLTIQKNGSTVATFTANQEGDSTANLIIPTTAADVGALPDSTTINDLTTTAQQAALNSGATSTNIAQIATNTGDISTINGKIPSAATTTNQLTDKDFVNSSIATNTANFIGTFNSVAELEAYSGTLTNNDYAFVVVTDSFGNTSYDRYKYTTATTPAGWQFEYELNNSSFTAAQWAAINSGANTSNIGQITINQNAIGTLSNLNTTAKTDLVSAVNEVEGVASTALQPNDNISSLTNDSGFISGITSSDVTTALGYTPADSASLATVATTGDYDDLLDKPTLGTMAAESASDYTKTSGLATVATSGSYNDLTNKPTIPTTTDNVTSGSSAALTSGGAYTALQSYATTSDIANMQTTTNLVTSVSSASTDSQYPSALCLYTLLGDVESLINAL